MVLGKFVEAYAVIKHCTNDHPHWHGAVLDRAKSMLERDKTMLVSLFGLVVMNLMVVKYL